MRLRTLTESALDVTATPPVIPREGGGALRGIHIFLLANLLSHGAAAETDPQTGLLVAAGYDQVKAQCTACHSGRLVAQNRADREGWLQMIRWMQDTQGLWPLGEAESVILDYLAEHYGPQPRGRRAPLNVTFD